MLKSFFCIEKTYLDGIDKEGNSFILYTAQLKIFNIKIPYSAIIFSNAQNQLQEQSKMQSSILKNKQNSLIFENKTLEIRGEWKRITHPIRNVLYTVKNKELVWNCHHPKTHFEIQFKNQTFKGLGYAETLQLPFLPWRLPISTLKWGRFLSENHEIIWIEWLGTQPQQWVYYNGKRVEKASITEEMLELPLQELTLHLENKQIIKQEKLLGIASKYKFLRIFFKKSFLESLETKYKALSVLKQHNTILETGWSLFEVVTWKK